MNENSQPAEKLVGVEVSSSALTAVCVEPDGKMSDLHSADVDLGADIAGQVAEFISAAVKGCSGGPRVGVAVPGLVNQLTRTIEFSTFVPSLENPEFINELTAATGCEIVLENDANAAGFAEFTLGAGRGSKSMFYVTLGTGIGGSLIIDGKIWHGAAGFAGEFGHIAINSEGLKLEGVASSESIVRRTQSRFHQDHTSSLNNLEESSITLADIIDAAKNEDDFARMMLERTGNYVGTAVATVINLLNIEMIVVGGEIMSAKHLVLDAIVARAREMSFAPSFETTQIVEGELGENAAAVGAALLSASKA